jgi:hypothetical protein
VYSVGSAIGILVFGAAMACGQYVPLPAPVPHPQSDPSNLTSAPTEAQISEWLQSDEPRLVAWGAHGVLEQKRREHVPELIEILSRWEKVHPQSKWDSAHFDALLAVVDALIQLDGRIPPATIREALARDGDSELQAPLLVLLLRFPAAEARPVWQSIMFSGDRYSAAARLAADVLSKNPPPGFAAKLLDGLSELAEVDVVDPDARLGYGNSPWGGFGCASAPGPREDWPSIGVYVFSDVPANSGSTLLIDEIGPVYVTRVQMRVDELSQSAWCLGHPLHTMPPFTYMTEDHRVKLIGRLIGAKPDEMPITLETHLSIDFRSVEQYRVQMAALVDGQLAQFTSVVGELCARGLMTADERRTTVPQIQVTVSDMRKSDQPPLPMLQYGYEVKVFYRRN